MYTPISCDNLNLTYNDYVIPKKNGVRVISEPNPELKKKQEEVLSQIYQNEWVSRHAHAFVKKRNVVSNAAVHVGKKYILKMDIVSFFDTITGARFPRYFNINGLSPRDYPVYRAALEDLINFIQDNKYIIFHNQGSHQGVTPPQGPALPQRPSGSAGNRTVLWSQRAGLPQGSPCSPALSNLAMRKFDTSILSLLHKYVSDDIKYSRYSDDMTFSSNSKALKAAIPIVSKQISALKFEINKEKTRFVTRGGAQRITGININSGVTTIPKKYRLRVRAIAHRVSVGWLITKEQLQALRGKISHISMCHPKEAARYLELLKDAQMTRSKSRKMSTSNYIYLPTGRQKTKKTNRTAPRTKTNKKRRVVSL